MRGVKFLTDDLGQKMAVLVDLKEHSAFWTEVLEEGFAPTEFQFLIDERGEKIAVLLDFENHGELWEDLYDILTTELLEDEPCVPWEEVKRELELKRKLSV
jgi:hypothetical protein